MNNRLVVSVFVLVAALVLSPPVFAQNAQPTPDPTPDLSGLWGRGGGGGAGAPTLSVYQGTADEPLRQTRRERGMEEFPLSNWGQRAFFYYTSADGEYGGETGGVGDPRYHGGVCGGPKSPSDVGSTLQIFQSPQLLMVTYQSAQPWIRKFWIGAEHPEDIGEYVPFWMGHSVSRWEGNMLVVDTVKIKEGPQLSNSRAAPQSGNLHMIERFELLDDGRLRIETTYDDPVAYTEPWSETITLSRLTDWEEMRFVWEIEESHAVCEAAGGYWAEHDPWFDNFDAIAEEILPDQETLAAGMPALPEGPAPEPYLGAFGQPRQQ